VLDIYKKNYPNIANEILKYLPINERIANLETKLAVDDLMEILRAEGVNV